MWAGTIIPGLEIRKLRLKSFTKNHQPNTGMSLVVYFTRTGGWESKDEQATGPTLSSRGPGFGWQRWHISKSAASALTSHTIV